MWIALAILAISAAVSIHLVWSKHSRHLEADLAELRAALKDAEAEKNRARLETQSRQQTLFNNMLEGVLVIGADDRIRVINRALTDLLQLDHPVEGQTLMQTLRSHLLAELIQKARTEGQAQGLELELGPASNPACAQVTAAALLDLHGAPEGVIVLFHDMTKLKQLENLRKEFVANVSHELRTPLSLIKGYVETLQDSSDAEPAIRERFLQTIARQTDRLAFLIEDLLTISRLEAGEADLQLQSVSVHDEIERVFEDLQNLAGEREMRMLNTVPPTTRATADPDRLYQVLWNLVENGLKYGRRGGVIETGVLESDSQPDQLTLKVRDDGPGIPQEAQERVFERFFRVDRARSREQGGTGLGLAIVKHIVQAHGGQVWLESEVNKGSCFCFTLPKPPNPSDREND